MPAARRDGATAAAPAGLETVPLELEFVGDFFHLADFFHDVKRFVHVANTDVVVNGRLRDRGRRELHERPDAFPAHQGELTATVYLAPKTEGATAGATPAGSADHDAGIDHTPGRQRLHARPGPDRGCDSVRTEP